MALTKITSDVIETGAITSDKLASGAVSASSLSSITTDNVSEGSTNTYFTNARARGSVSVTGGGLSYDSGTGVIQIGSIPNASLTNSSLTVNSNSVSLGGSVTLDTDDIGEGSTNLYFTNARAQGAISGGTGVTVSSGTISIGQDVATSSTPTFGNITTTGYIAGPATFTIDPAAVGDNTGTVVIAGNLQVDGTTTTINSTTMEVDDLNITLASGAANAAAADGAGITVDGASATITYDGTNDEWDFNKDINVTGSITTGQSMSINNSQVGVIQQAHGITSGNTVANKFQVGRWKGVTFDRWMLVPIDDGTAQYSNEFGYNFSTSAWFFDSLVNFAGNITLGDNNKAIFGDDSDLQIYHDGSNSRIQEAGTGSLLVRGTNLQLQDSDGYDYLTCTDGGNGGTVVLKHLGSAVLSTTSTGIDVTGTVTSDGLTVDGAASNYNTIQFTSGSTGHGTIVNLGDTSDVNYGSITQFATSAGEGGRMRFIAGTTETMNLRGGNVGIGVTDPEKKLEVKSDTTYDGILIDVLSAPEIRLRDRGNSDTLIGTGRHGLDGFHIDTYSGNALFIRGSNRQVGIGETNPQTELHVKGTNNSAGDLYTAVGPGNTPSITIQNAGTTNNNNAVLYFRDDTGMRASVGARFVNHTTDETELRFSTTDGSGNTRERVTISGSGNVGIGTTNPLNKLHVNGNVHIGDGEDYSSYAKLAVYDDVYQGDVGLLIKNDRYNDGSATASLIFEHRTHAGQGHAAKIICRRQGAYNESAGSKDAALDFYTANGGTLARHMVLNRSGQFGVGNDDIFDAYAHHVIQSDTTQKVLDIKQNNSTGRVLGLQYIPNGPDDTTDYYMVCSDSNTNDMFIYSNGNVANKNNSYGSSSDIKIKQNISDANSQWNDIKALQFKNYKLKTDVAKYGEDNADTLLGLIAQDVETAGMNGLVYESKDEDSEGNKLDTVTKGIKYSVLYLKAVKALQEAIVKIEDLESRITELEG